jgi:hypothetical protein
MAKDRSASQFVIVGFLSAVVGALISGAFNYLDHQRDLDAKMIELSIGILRAEPNPDTTPLREWAIDVMEKRARFSFSMDQRTTLLKKPLPFGKGGKPGDVAFISACTNGTQMVCYYVQDMTAGNCSRQSC